MMIRYMPICILLSCCLAIFGCADHRASLGSRSVFAGAGSQVSAVARLTTNEAVRIAVETAAKSGKYLDKYEVPQAYYSSTQRLWMILFDGKETTPGNHFSVEVDDATGSTQLYPGL